MFWILMGMLEEDDNEDWVIGVVDQVMCADFEVLEGVISVVDQVICTGFKVLERIISVIDWVMCADFNITGEIVSESEEIIFKFCLISAGILRR